MVAFLRMNRDGIITPPPPRTENTNGRAVRYQSSNPPLRFPDIYSIIEHTVSDRRSLHTPGSDQEFLCDLEPNHREPPLPRLRAFRWWTTALSGRSRLLWVSSPDSPLVHLPGSALLVTTLLAGTPSSSLPAPPRGGHRALPNPGGYSGSQPRLQDSR